MNIASRAVGTTTVGDMANPVSGLTTITAAGMVVMLTTALAQAFDLPPVKVALALSAFFAWGQVFVMSDTKGKRLAVLVFLTITSAFTIFCAARGGNATMAQIEERVTPAPVAEQVTSLLDFIVPEVKAYPVHGTPMDGMNAILITEFQQPTNNVTKPIFKPW